MKKKLISGLAFIGLTAFMLTGCSKIPHEEIDAANAAIEQAAEAGADVYVHDEFVTLQDSMNSVMVSIELQKSKFISNFSSAKKQLVGVSEYAGEVKQQAEIRKEQIKIEIQNTIAEVKQLIVLNRELILEAPKGKEGTSALAAIKGEIDAVETSVEEASALIETGDYLTTLEKVKTAKEKASSINTELTNVIAKYKANVKGLRS